jgi:hypothetical protein
MQKADLNTVYDFGQTQPMAPSIKRADLLGWIGASLAAGLLAAFLAMAFVWREWPGLPAPGGALMTHIAYWGKSLVHCKRTPIHIWHKHRQWFRRRQEQVRG